MPTNNGEVLRIRALPDPRKYFYKLNWDKRRDGSLISPKNKYGRKAWFAALRVQRKERWRALMNPQSITN